MGQFIYDIPKFEYDEKGNMVIIRKRCLGPIEVIIYGITREGEFYFDWIFPKFYPDDSELERDYRIISKEEILEEINVEIDICKKEGRKELVEKYIQAVNIIKNNY